MYEVYEIKNQEHYEKLAKEIKLPVKVAKFCIDNNRNNCLLKNFNAKRSNQFLMFLPKGIDKNVKDIHYTYSTDGKSIIFNQMTELLSSDGTKMTDHIMDRIRHYREDGNW